MTYHANFFDVEVHIDGENDIETSVTLPFRPIVGDYIYISEKRQRYKIIRVEYNSSDLVKDSQYGALAEFYGFVITVIKQEEIVT